MPRFIGSTTIASGEFTREEYDRFVDAALEDENVFGYRAQIDDGQAVCIMEAPDQDAVALWFHRIGLLVETVTEISADDRRLQDQTFNGMKTRQAIVS